MAMGTAMRSLNLSRTASTSLSALPPSRLLQRKCACGGAAGLTGRCEGCEQKRVAQPSISLPAGPAFAPPSVERVLASPGRPLDTGTRSFMERRFGHDFSRVSVHTDSEAAHSARQVNARAYTVGNHMVFGEGEYRPGFAASDKVIAHELAHVIQQGASTCLDVAGGGHGDRQGMAPMAAAPGMLGGKEISSAYPEALPNQTGATIRAKLIVNIPGDRYEQEADRIAEQIMRMSDPHPDTAGNGTSGSRRSAQALQRLSYSPLFDESGAEAAADESGMEAPNTEKTESGSGPVQILQRVPADFGGGTPNGKGVGPSGLPGPPSGSTLPYREATELLDCIRILGEANADYCHHVVLGVPLPAVPPPQCVPDRELTWADFTGTPPARSRFAADTAYHYEIVQRSGFTIIQAILDSAKSWVRPAAADATNRSATDCGRLVRQCTRSLKNNPGSWSLSPPAGCAASISPDTSLAATTTAECDTVIGAECDSTAVQESERLLRHEQYHFKLACAIAGKGTAAVQAGSGTSQQILRSVRTKDSTLHSRYDAQTDHGCNQADQNGWEADIDGGLNAVTIP
jgi:hypothetical protein